MKLYLSIQMKSFKGENNLKLSKKQGLRLKFILSLSIISSVMLLLIPLEDIFGDSVKKVISIIIASIFWLGIIFIFIINHSMSRDTYKYYIANRNENNKDLTYSKRPGAFRFGRNVQSVVSTIICIVGIIILIIDLFQKYLDENIFFIVIFISYLSFCCHCIFDGENYRYYKIIKGEDKK